MDSNKGHCNGSKYVVTHIHSNVIEAEVADGAFQGNRIFIPRIGLKTNEDMFPFCMTRKQFPVRPCFALTANKSQGQTLQRVGIYLQKHFFSHGQYYVAQSRVGSSESLQILGPRSNVYTTDNVVYPEVLQ